jgi:hypothetical protein
MLLAEIMISFDSREEAFNKDKLTVSFVRQFLGDDTDAHTVEFNEERVPAGMLDVTEMESSHYHVGSSMAKTSEDDFVVLEIPNPTHTTCSFGILHIC